MLVMASYFVLSSSFYFLTSVSDAMEVGRNE